MNQKNQTKISCRIFKEQMDLINNLPEKDRVNVLYLAVNNAFNNQLENQDENQDENQVDNQDDNQSYLYLYHISLYKSLSELSKSVLNIFYKTIEVRDSSNWGGERKGAGRKKTPRKKTTKTQDGLNNYGEFGYVCLEESFYNNLIDKYGEEKTKYGIERMDTWLAKPKQEKVRNQDHKSYFKSNGWVWDDYKEPKPNRKKFVVEYDLNEINKEITPEDVIIPAAYVGVK